MKAMIISLLRRFSVWYNGKDFSCPRTKAEMEAYRVAVTKLANENGNRRFLNGEEWHAEMVAGLMVSKMNETDEVLIYSKALKPAFYAKILRDTKCRFRIILDEPEFVNVDIWKHDLSLDFLCRLIFRLTEQPEKRHFLVAGDAFRYQDTDFYDELSVVCNFHEPEVSQRLRDRFEKLWVGATPFPIVP